MLFRSVVLINFMREANREDFDYTVVLPRGSLLIPRLQELNVNIVEMDGIAEKSFAVSQISAFRKLFKELKPDVVHTHASLSARVAARLCGKIKIVYTRHCAYTLEKKQTVFPRKQIAGIVNNKYSDAIIAISPAACENLTDTGADIRKITTMFNGVDPVVRLGDEEKAALRERFGVAQDDFVCAIIARLEDVKGHEYIIEAAKLLSDLPVKILIAGTGSIEKELHKHAELLGLTNVIFLGFVGDIYTVENVMDLQLNASYGTEASSLSLLEGMSLGIPAVVSNFGGNPYLIPDGENGLVVPKQNAEAMAEAVRRIYNDRELYDKLSKGAEKIYAERFTAATPVRAVEDIYRRLYAGRKK